MSTSPLNISKEERERLLTECKLFEQSDESTKGSEAAVAKIAGTQPANVPSEARLSDVYVQRPFDPAERSDDEGYLSTPLPEHDKFTEKLAKALAKAMKRDMSARVPSLSHPRTPQATSGAQPTSGEHAFNSIRELDEKELAMRLITPLMEEPFAPFWIRRITFKSHERDFTAVCRKERGKFEISAFHGTVAAPICGDAVVGRIDSLMVFWMQA